MRVHIIPGLSLGLALAASAANAQQPVPKTTASDQRISISKGEVQLVARDTVIVTRTDTVRMVRTDTVRVPRLVTRTQVDTHYVPVAYTPPVVRGPVYAAVFGGAMTPAGNVDRLYSTGVQVGGMLGWEQAERLVGLRIRAHVTQLDREAGLSAALVGARAPMIFGLASDLKLTLPQFAGWAPYAVGGGGLHYFRGLALAAESGSMLCGADGRGGCYRPARDDDWSLKYGYGFGGGADFDFGRQAMFVEARANVVHAAGARSWFIPLTLGARFF